MRWVGSVILFSLSMALLAQKPAIDPHHYIVKFKPGTASSNHLSSQENQAQAILKRPLSVSNEIHNKSHSVLNNTFKISVNPGTDIQTLCDSLNQLDHVVYAEPIYLEELLDRPNDPAAQPGNQQRYLDIIKAIDAWGLSKSNTTIKIAIIDSGIHLDHEDLISKLYENDDPINGLDDDGNGYIDDQFGYDFADRDPDATADLNQHGTHVAGIAGAATNNEKGIAGVGYNVSITPLKIFRSSDGLSANSYEAILYAAENSYDIATLSWGSINTFSQFNQDIITYAAKEKNLILIGAAGNTNSEVYFYPASYEHVISVGATNDEDKKAGFSTFNDKIDLSAPGQSIYSTQKNNTYGSDNGTSHAVPQVAGVAALVKHRYPELNASQIMERIRVTADDIYGIQENQPFRGKLGSGRLNAFRAVSENNLISIRLSEIQISNSSPFFGDTIKINADFINYLDPAVNPTIQISTSSPFLSFDHTHFSIGYVPTLGTFSIPEIVGIISENTPPDTEISYTVTITEKKYTEVSSYKIKSAPDHLSIKNPNLKFNIGGNGNMGDSVLVWNNAPVLIESGILIANGYDQVADHVLSNWQTGAIDQDFQSILPIKKYPHPIAHGYASSKFESTANAPIHDLIINQEVFVFDTLSSTVLKLHITNNSTDTLTQSRFGFLSNWNLGDFVENSAFWDLNNTAFVFDSLETAYAAARILGGHSSNFSAIKNERFESNNGILSDLIKWILMTSATNDSLGFEAPLDVLTTLSTRLDTLNPKTSKIIYVIFAVANSFDQIKATLNETEKKIDKIQAHPFVIETLLTCEGGQAIIDPKSGNEFLFFRDPFGLDTIGRGESVIINLTSSEMHIYVSNLDKGYADDIRSIKILGSDDIADFSMDTDTLYLGDVVNNRIHFRDQSLLSVNWMWDFGNGQKATGIQNPSTIYSIAGIYSVNLTVETAQGCNVIVSKNLTVLQRPNLPELENQILCPGTQLVFINPNNNALRVYIDATNPGIVADGDSISLGMIANDTSFYLTQVVEGIESQRKLVTIQLNDLDSSYSVLPVLDSLNGNYVTIELSDNNGASIEWKIDGEIVSDTTLFIWKVEKEFYFLQSSFINKNGCLVTFSDSLKFTPAPLPVVNIPSFCLGNSVIISATNGVFFGLYIDENLTIPISKGNHFNVSSISSDTVFYIAGLDGILPGIPLAVNLEPIDFRFEIQSEPDSLLFPENISAKFSINLPAITYRWFVNDRLETNVPSPVFFFADTGNYLIRIQATNEFNCKHTDTLVFKVYEFVEPPLSISNLQLFIYPNPMNDQLMIESNEIITEIELYSLNGKLLLRQSGNVKVLDTSALKSGVYQMKIKMKNGEIFISKIIKKIH